MTQKNRDEISDLVSTSDDLKFLLRHFISPHAFQAYLKFKNESNKFKQLSSIGNGNINLFAVPSQESSYKFFQALNEGSKGINIIHFEDI